MRLRRSDVSGAGLTRQRCGRGFRYLAAGGGRADPADLERIKALVIPPAWRDVWICPWPNGHIQAVGVDDAGRRQYLYHEGWRRRRDAEKYDRVLGLAPLLPDFRKAVAEDLAGSGFTHVRVLAAGQGRAPAPTGCWCTGPAARGTRYAPRTSTPGSGTWSASGTR